MSEGVIVSDDSLGTESSSCFFLNERDLHGVHSSRSLPEQTTVCLTNINESICDHATGSSASLPAETSSGMIAAGRCACPHQPAFLDITDNCNLREEAHVDESWHEARDWVAGPATRSHSHLCTDRRPVAGSARARASTSQEVTVRDAPRRKFQMCPCDGHTLPCSQQELSQKRKLEIPSCHPGSLRDYDVLSSPSVKRHPMECACAALQSNFLRMAETAYRSIRRKDTSAASFEQFKRELTQTNYLLKESASLIACIKQMCEHWAHLHVRQQVCPPSHVIESCCQVRHLAS